MDIVIGSGPAGVFCAQALIDKGRKVLMIDYGSTLEAATELARKKFASLDRVALLNSDTSKINSIIPLNQDYMKLSLGSDYPYRLPEHATQWFPKTTGLRGSYAMGGFSNVWGSAMLPYRSRELRGWPISENEMANAYHAVSKYIPICAEYDSLSDTFPIYSDSLMDMQLSRQASALYERLKVKQESLKKNGIYFGKARLAVHLQDYESNNSCILCGKCLSGCPRDLIFSTRHLLKELIKKGLNYQSGYLVRTVNESSAGVEINAFDKNGSSQKIFANRVFLAAGSVNTTEIILRSEGFYDRTIEMIDSQYYLFPIVRPKGFPNVNSEPLNTLCQLFIEVDDPALSQNTSHLQIYSYNNFLPQLLKSKTGVFSRLIPVNALLSRLMFVQGYLNSEQSGKVNITLKHQSGGEVLSVIPVTNSNTRIIVIATIKKLQKITHLTHALPILQMLEITAPGRGFHTGGSFPMSDQPSPEKTDTLGRPFRKKRIHLVDSSVFPSIPAQTITFSVMANAYRIGSEVCKLNL